MGLFQIFKKKEIPPKEKVYDLGQVGSNPNQKLVKKGNKLFIQEKGFMGAMKEVPIHKDTEQETEEKTGEIKNEKQ
jgi:hypothetical protein